MSLSHPVFRVAAAAVLLFAALPSGRVAQAEVINLFPVADTTLRNGLSADTSYGASTALPVGVSSGGGTVNHVLLKFQIESIPPNASITQVSLQITSVNGNLSTPNYNLFRVLKNWSETEATWNTRLAPAMGWASPGGQPGLDFLNAFSATAPLAPAPSVNRFTSAGMLADVQLWQANPGTNFGWILIADNEQPGSGKQIASRENPLNTPLLTVSYSLPALPPSPVLFAPARVNAGFRFSFNSASNHAYVAEASSSLSPTNWIPFMNILPLTVDSVIHVTNTAVGTERYFRVVAQ